MKSNELMVGDIVYALSSRGEEFSPVKVKNIYDADEDEPCGTIMDNYGRIIGSYEFKPIPLTPDILMANGFKRRKTYACPRYSLIDNIGRKLISFLHDNTGYEIQVGGNRVRLNYVHELQHALRLCGLNDFANYFKIE